MKYSDYTIDQIKDPMYEKVAQKLLSLAKDEDTNLKLNGILYEGGFDEFSVNGNFHMEKKVLYKNNPSIEQTKRLNMGYLLLKNPQMFSVIQKSNAHFFHGTNANALPNILKYGINSVNTSIENNIDVTTGEEWTRIQGKRSFISLTDCLKASLLYANREPINNNSTNSLLNFGVIIGTSFEDMNGLNVSGITSDISEIGVLGNLPLNHIKFLAVPNDKVEFVKKMVGQKDIKVISMDIKDRFFNVPYKEMLNILDKNNENIELQNSSYPTYSKDDIKPLVNQRKISKIKDIFEYLKEKIHISTKQTDTKDISERS